jgi:hypothetical protein
MWLYTVQYATGTLYTLKTRREKEKINKTSTIGIPSILNKLS